MCFELNMLIKGIPKNSFDKKKFLDFSCYSLTKLTFSMIKVHDGTYAYRESLTYDVTILVFIITVKFFNGTCKSLPRAGEQKCGENL